MRRELLGIDVADIPELLRIAEEVRNSGDARVLQRGDQALAVIMPIPVKTGRAPSKLSEEDRAAFLSSAGGWKNVDADKLLDDIYANRRISDRPPVNL